MTKEFKYKYFFSYVGINNRYGNGSMDFEYKIGKNNLWESIKSIQKMIIKQFKMKISYKEIIIQNFQLVK